ncbi:unnamed protein product, partial [Mesorhabditis belari]|uniref:Tubulin-specific chaperone D n=1 Tax=Mesorhabditis belari TaxID=2138241 RepID=A0AAF3F876_9BILA
MRELLLIEPGPNGFEEKIESPQQMDEDEDGVIGCLPSHLQTSHRIEIQNISTNVRFEDEKNFEKVQERFKKLLEIYAEQPSLLDPLIPETVFNLSSVVNLTANDGHPKILDERSALALMLLFTLIKIRGYKTIMKFLPREIHHLKPIVSCLEQYGNASPALQSCRICERTTLLYWLTIVCMNPFDLRRLDANDQETSTLKRILIMVKPLLSVTHSTIHFAAARLIAECIARAEGQHLCKEVIDDCIAKICTNGQKESFGELILILNLLKHVPRQVIAPFVNEISSIVSLLFEKQKSNPLIRKYLSKAARRISLVMLSPTLCQWRYQRGRRKLEENITNNDMSRISELEANMTQEGPEQGEAAPDSLVQRCIGLLMQFLNDNDTAVRWSAAKGIGRITERLHRELAAQIVSTLLKNNFLSTNGYASWHGGCLALAELSWRGALLPEHLTAAFSVIQNALTFEEKVGRFAWGSCVRDAACFVLWSWARAYRREDLQQYLEKTATGLICCALFDREISVRRAASATFQELVGRVGGISHGIELLTLVDYFAVSNRRKCFSLLCVAVSEFYEYLPALLDHLIEFKVCHWDEKMRVMCGLAFESLATRYPRETWARILRTVFPLLKKAHVPVMHGALFTLAHTLRGLSSVNFQIESHIVKELIILPRALQPQVNSNKNLQGELLRLALSHYVALLSECNFPIDAEEFNSWMYIVESCCCDEKEAIRLAGNEAAEKVVGLLRNIPNCAPIVINNLIRVLKEPSREWQRGGACQILENLPISVPIHSDLIDLFCTIITRSVKAEEKWAFARACAVKSLSQICKRQRFNSEEWAMIKKKIFNVFMVALDDYTEDARGDIGRFVRCEAMKAMTTMLCDEKETITKDEVTQVLCQIIQQSAEKIGRLRETAATCIKTILVSTTLPGLNNVDLLRELYACPDLFIYDKQLYSLRPLLSIKPYSASILHGLVLSAGGISEVTAQFALQALHEYLDSATESEAEEAMAILVKFIQSPASPRLSLPLLRVLSTILPRIPHLLTHPDRSTEILNILTYCRKVLSNPRVSPVNARLCLNAISPLLLSEPRSSTWKFTMTIIVSCLSCPYPAVRCASAETLTEALCTMEIVDDELIGLLSDTQWQGSGTMAKGGETEWQRAALEIHQRLIVGDTRADG